MRSLGAFIVLLLLAGVAGCDLFKPADPELPQGGAPPILIDYGSPEGVLKTVRLAIQAKGIANAAVAYSGAFADSEPLPGDGHEFRAFVSPEILSRLPENVDPQWSFDKEQNFYGLLINKQTQPYAMRWLKDDPHPDDTSADDQVTLHRKYLIQTLPPAGVQSVVVVRGIADLYLSKVPTAANRWVIYRWEDRVDPDTTAAQTYGELRLSPS
jgi:hypothetical protein